MLERPGNKTKNPMDDFFEGIVKDCMKKRSLEDDSVDESVGHGNVKKAEPFPHSHNPFLLLIYRK